MFTEGYLNILHVNIRSLQKNFDNLVCFIKCLPKPPDIIAVTETWLKESTQQLYQLDGYEAHHIYRTTREHGGVSFFINNDCHAELIKEHTFVNDSSTLNTINCQVIFKDLGAGPANMRRLGGPNMLMFHKLWLYFSQRQVRSLGAGLI